MRTIWEEPGGGTDREVPPGRTQRVLSAARIGSAVGLVVIVVGGVVIWARGAPPPHAPPRPVAATRSLSPSTSSPQPGTAAPVASQAAGFARRIGSFGGEGNGPGLLDDAREVAVDGDGDIWVADYEDGRVQEFDPGGRFRRLLMVPPDKQGDQRIITGLAADGRGRLYVAAGGSIFAYDSRTGRQVWRFLSPFPFGAYIEDVAVDANGVLYGLQGQATANVLWRFSGAGKPVKHWPDIVQKVNHKDPAMDLELAIDGLGHFYLASSFGAQVYHYDSAGAFVDRFGEEGDLPGQFDNPGSIAADGHGHLYINGNEGIDQYATGGRFIDRLTVGYDDGGTPMGLTIDRNSVLYVVTNRGMIQKYQLARS